MAALRHMLVESGASEASLAHRFTNCVNLTGWHPHKITVSSNDVYWSIHIIENPLSVPPHTCTHLSPLVERDTLSLSIVAWWFSEGRSFEKSNFFSSSTNSDGVPGPAWLA